jgi:hypothetical protein
VRADGGEAGLHPSNIHDNPYAIGAVDFTGDMPVILGPDGPSLGGFVCPVTVIEADLWQLGQLKAGDKVQFVPVDIKTARHLVLKWDQCGSGLAREQPPHGLCRLWCWTSGRTIRGWWRACPAILTCCWKSARRNWTWSCVSAPMP